MEEVDTTAVLVPEDKAVATPEEEEMSGRFANDCMVTLLLDLASLIVATGPTMHRSWLSAESAVDVHCEQEEGELK